MKCENCPAEWEHYECDSCGCLILGKSMFDADCKMSATEIEKRIQQLKDYEAGKIERPQWVANRFMRELDHSCAFSGKPGYGLPAYPPHWMSKGVYFPLYGSTELHYQGKSKYRRGYEDAQAGKEPDPDYENRSRSATYEPNAETKEGEIFTQTAAHTLEEAIKQFNIWTEHYHYDIEEAWIIRREYGKENVRLNLERKWRIRT